MDFPNKDANTETSQTDEVLRKFSFGERFEAQQKQGLRLGTLVLGGVFGASSSFLGVRLGLTPVFYVIPIIIGCVFFFVYQTLTAQASQCPSCKQNITTCSSICCHRCGEKLKGGRCERCGVDQSWMVAFRPTYELSGNDEYITYCPRCGVCLNSKFRRFKGG